jgi:hypothetical protein
MKLVAIGMNIIKYFVMSTKLKRFLIHCSTEWCGMDDTYRAVAEKEEDLWEIADQLAYDNFMSYGGPDLILEDYDTEDMTEEEIETILEDVDESAYYYSSIEECEDDEEWNSYLGEIIGENNE